MPRPDAPSLAELVLEQQRQAERKAARERAEQLRERAREVGAQVHARRTWVALTPFFTNIPERSA